MNKKEIVEKLNSIVKSGYVPSRGKTSYFKLNESCNKKQNIGLRANCFMHACFNLTNEQLAEFDGKLADIVSFDADYNHTTLRQAKSLLRSSGLIVKPCKMPNPQLQHNQWCVAFYTEENAEIGEEANNWHFLLQERDGEWTSKRGFSGDVTSYGKLPDKIEKEFTPWVLRETIIITNPFAEQE